MEPKRMKTLTRREFLRQTSAAGSALAIPGLVGLLQASCKRPKPPNLLIVFPDQMRGQALGFLGEEHVITPNLDRFAAESIVFTEAVSNYPLCSPYRGMLMTGEYPHSNRVLYNCNSQSAPFGCELKREARCWSDVLKDKGYSLGYIGKWHLDAPRKPYVDCENNRGEIAWNEWCPPERRHGFDFWYAYGTYDEHFRPMYWSTRALRSEPHWVDQWGPEHEADLAIRYIKNDGGKFRKPGKPFALVVAMNPPHMPYELVPQKYVDLYGKWTTEDLCNRPNIPEAGTRWGDYYRKNIRHYYAMITGVDDQFGRILDVLKAAGLEKDTIVVFTSDHGNCLGIHNAISKNNPYEESMRIPLMIRWPGEINPRRDDLLLSVPDLYPTLLDLMGFSADIPPEVEGKTHAPLLLTGKGGRPRSQVYIRVPVGHPAWGSRGVRNHRFTLVIHRMPDSPVEVVLFDREKDPFQLKNIADASPGIVADLIQDDLRPWMEFTRDPWWDNTKPVLKGFM